VAYFSPLLSLFFGAFFLSSSAILARYSDAGAITITFYRMLISTLILMIVTPVVKWPLKKDSHQLIDFIWLLITGLCFAASMFTWYGALEHTSIANVAFLGNISPIFVALLAWVFLKEKCSFIVVLGIAVAVIGSFILVAKGISLSLEETQGNVLSILSALFYAGYFLGLRRVALHFSPQMILLSTGIITTLAAAIFLVLADESIAFPTATQWLIFFGLAVFVQILGQGLTAKGLQKLPAFYSAVTCFVSPLLAISMAALFFNEQINLFQAIGGFIIFCGLILVANHRHEKVAAA
jgi:drug/metabolite transporter (DMT)-like permease